jgi:hypothetical protein
MNNEHVAFVVVILAPLALAACVGAWAQQARPSHIAEANLSLGDLPPWNVPPTPRQIHALVSRTIDNQHRDDLALNQYERKERIISERGKEAVANERLTEVIPAGIHHIRIELERDGQPADSDILEQRWQQAAQAVQAVALDTEPGELNVKQDDERGDRRAHERYEMVDAVGRAFRFHWIGREDEGDRKVLEFSFEPDPSYKSSKIFAIVYAHIVGTIWVDEASSQVVRIDARLKDDISIGAGLIVKVYRGAQATLKQQEVESGVWEPVHYSFDFEGRKLLFGTLSGHERMDASDYRAVGSLEDAIATFRREHRSTTASSR